MNTLARRVVPACLATCVACFGGSVSSPDRQRAAAGADGDAGAAPRFDAGALEADAAQLPTRRLPHNLIVFMGDGMGIAQLSTGRFARDGRLRIDALAGPALANTDSLTTLASTEPAAPATDSAAAGTVLATGVRVHNGAISQGPDGVPLQTVLEVYKDAGKATGLVTTSYFVDASPAAFGAHQASRADYEAIAHDLLERSRPDVIMGSGAGFFDDPALGLHDVAAAAGYVVVRSDRELLAWDPLQQPRLLGLFDTDFIAAARASEEFSMTPALERRPDSPDPDLATMTRRAMERLSADPDGFFLFAEDELFDQMGHRGPAEVAWTNRAYPAQAAAFDDAVAVAIDWVLARSSFGETLIVVTADHETGGYHYDPVLGPGSGAFGAFTEGTAFRVGLHTRELVPVYALGPGSDALTRVGSHADTHSLMLGELR